MNLNRIAMVTALTLGVAVAACDRDDNARNDKTANTNPPTAQRNDQRTDDLHSLNGQDRAGTPDENRLIDQQKQDEKASIDQQKRDYHARLDAEIKDLDGRIDDMKKTADNEKGAAKDADQKLVKDVENRRSVLKDDMSSIDSAKPEEWDGLKAKADRDLQDLRQSVRTASTRLHVTPRGDNDVHLRNGTMNNNAPTNPQPVAPTDNTYRDTTPSHNSTK